MMTDLVYIVWAILMKSSLCMVDLYMVSVIYHNLYLIVMVVAHTWKVTALT